MEQPKGDICILRVVFPVESDEQAIEIKKKVTELLQGVDNSQMQFSIMPPSGRAKNELLVG